MRVPRTLTYSASGLFQDLSRTNTALFLSRRALFASHCCSHQVQAGPPAASLARSLGHTLRAHMLPTQGFPGDDMCLGHH